MTVAIPLIDPTDQAAFTIDWSDVVGGASMGAVLHTVPPPLTKISESSDTPNKLSTVKVSGAIHGGMYLIDGLTTLSNGETINRQFPLRCFNG